MHLRRLVSYNFGLDNVLQVTHINFASNGTRTQTLIYYILNKTRLSNPEVRNELPINLADEEERRNSYKL